MKRCARLLQPLLLLWAVASTSDLRLRGQYSTSGGVDASAAVVRSAEHAGSSVLQFLSRLTACKKSSRKSAGHRGRNLVGVPCDPYESNEQMPKLPEEIPEPPLPPPMPPAKPPLPPEPPTEGSLVEPPPTMPQLAGAVTAEVVTEQTAETVASQVAAATAASAQNATAASVAVAAAAAAASHAAIDAGKSPGEVAKIAAEEAKKAGGTDNDAAMAATIYGKIAAEEQASPVAPPHAESMKLEVTATPLTQGTAASTGIPPKSGAVPGGAEPSPALKRKLNSAAFEPVASAAGLATPPLALEPIDLPPPPALPQPLSPTGLDPAAGSPLAALQPLTPAGSGAGGWLEPAAAAGVPLAPADPWASAAGVADNAPLR